MEEDLVGATIAGRYRVVRKLGEGGMGTVYVAVQEPLGREVALKVIRGELTRDAGAIERFKREATTLSQLAHPNVVTIFDFGMSDGVLFLAMELLRGETLRARVKSEGALHPDVTLPIVRDIASGLAVAHSAGVIHRDLKPDNVMLVAAFGRSESAKILDFGVAKLASAQAGATLTQAGMIVGTPGYMAPELAMEGVMNDPRSDLYALGVMWFEMLVGRALFEATTPVMLLMKHATQEPGRPRELMPTHGISDELEGLVMRLLAKSPSGRPPSAEELVRELDDITGAAPRPRARGQHFAGPVTEPDLVGTAPTMAGLGSSAKLSRAPVVVSQSVDDPDAALAAAMPRWLRLFAAGAVVAVLVIIAGAVALLIDDGPRQYKPMASRIPVDPAAVVAPVKPVAPAPVVAPVAPVAPAPVAPVEPAPVAPVEPAPVEPVEPDAVAPVEPASVAPVEPAAPVVTKPAKPSDKPKPKPKKPTPKQPPRVPELED